MAALRGNFVELGFTNVRTFIASGNVIFDSPAKPGLLERRIEKHLHSALGYEVDTFIRSRAEVLQVVADVESQFAAQLADGSKVYVGFLRALPPVENQERVIALSNAVDVMSFGERELYWLCHKSMADTTVKGPGLAKALGGPMTARNITSLRKLIATFEASK